MPRRSTSRGSHDDAPKRKRLKQEQQQQSKDRQQAGARGNDPSDLRKGDGARSTSDGAPSDDRDPGQVLDMDASPDASPPPASTINPLALRINGSPDVTISASLNPQAPRLAPPTGWVEDPDRPASNEHAEDSISPGANEQKIVRGNPLEYSSQRTGICYDVRMRFHATVDEEDLHPEDPRRIFEIYKAICAAKLIHDPKFLGVVKQNDLMAGILARPVTKEEALLVHEEQHWKFLESTQQLGVKDLQRLSKDGDSVYYNAESFFCARLSCGGVIETCFAVMDNRVKNAIAVVRPPGHHAEPQKAMGFCLLNNVCVATKAVQKRYQNQCKKVLILDWFVPLVMNI
jgi:histone deacetylase 6